MHSWKHRQWIPGGSARGSAGSFYHLSFRSGSRASGSCAKAAHAYITRTGEYDGPDHDPAIYTESDHLPSWAQAQPDEYWDAADLYERANGRLYISADFALPRDVDLDDQIGLAHALAQELTADERLPYTLAIHAGRDGAGHEHNPHAHLMISERQNDGHERSREQWFRRANSEHPERGGAPKSRTFHGREWMEHARERWASLTNAALERRGHHQRVDHRSYQRQGVDREPGEHYGPGAAHMVARGLEHERLENADTIADRLAALRALELEEKALENAREAPIRESGASATSDGASRGGADREDDFSRGR
jgi:hypothetical protein